MRKAILVTGSEAILKVDAETGFIWEKLSHSNEPCSVAHNRGDSCSCYYMNKAELNTCYADIRRFNLNDRTRDYVSGEIDILYIGYEKWDGTYERPLNEFYGIDSEGYIANDKTIVTVQPEVSE